MQTYKLFEGDRVLLTQPHLVSIFGRAGATFLNQIHYWITKNNVGVIHDGQNWIYNTAKEWGRQICLSERQVHHYIKKFSAMGIVLVKKLNAKHYDRTNYITINYTALNAFNSSAALVVSHSAVSAESKRKKPHILYTEITSKEINNKSKGQGDKKNNTKAVPLQSLQPVEQVDNNLDNNKKFEQKTETNSQTDTPLKRTIAQDMLGLWQKAFPEIDNYMDKTLARHLVAAFNHKFSKNLMYWKNYLDRLQSSGFIMSNSFVLKLDWALKFKTIDRILKGDLGVKDIPVKLDVGTQEQKATSHVDGVDESDPCKNVRRMLIKAVGSTSYNAWFTKVRFVEKNGKIQMKAENKFVEDYITQHYSHYLA